MFFEGFGVDHVHSKLSPMHGTGDLTHWKPIEARQNKFFEQFKMIQTPANQQNAIQQIQPNQNTRYGQVLCCESLKTFLSQFFLTISDQCAKIMNTSNQAYYLVQNLSHFHSIKYD